MYFTLYHLIHIQSFILMHPSHHQSGVMLLFLSFCRKMSGDWKPTVPRGPIAAMTSSPGPVYALPGLVGQPKHDPRSSHSRGPAYAFGIRHGKFADDCSPGPAYLPNAKIYKDGMDGTPHYSLYGRKRDLTA